jgi:ubiquinone/menaquinone biosynthesis C-methylase UbiE
MPDLTSKTYWNERARENGSKLDCVLVDHRANRHQNLVEGMLEPYKNMSVLDVACGYGRFSPMFKNYTGIDFCPEMIELAQKTFPGKRFIEATDIQETFDVVFAVISLSSLNITAQEFNARWKDRARVAVMVFEVDTFYIFPKI